MQSWNLLEIETPGGSRSPVVLMSHDEARAVLIGLEPGQQLGDHQVHEAAFVAVVDGSLRVEAGGETLEAGAGTLIAFEPRERRSISTRDGARLVILFAPWPGAGHYRAEESTRAPASEDAVSK